MTAFDPKQATLQHTAETPLLFASCHDVATGSVALAHPAIVSFTTARTHA